MWSISYRKFLMLDIELCFTWDQLYLFKKTEKFQNIMTMIAFQFYYYKCYLDHCVFLYWLFHFQLSSLTEEYCHWLINPLHCFNSKNSPILCLLKFVTKPCSGNWSGVSSHWKDTFEMFLHLAIYNDSYIKKNWLIVTMQKLFWGSLMVTQLFQVLFMTKPCLYYGC